MCVANLAYPPPPARCTKEAALASTGSRHPFAPADNRRPRLPPHTPPQAALAAATSLFTRCRGSGVVTSHVSRGPGALGPAAPHGAGQQQRSLAPEAEKAKGLPPGPSPQASALHVPSPQGTRNLSASLKVNFVCVISSSAPLPTPPLAGSPREYF